MHKRRDRRDTLQQWGLATFGVFAVGMSLEHILNGELSYWSWTNSGLVFTPLILLFGVLALLAAIFDWQKFWTTQHSKRHER